MPECECLPSCPFFKGEMAIEEELGKTYRSYYCHNGNLVCARYAVFRMLGAASVPSDLYPHQLDRVRDIVVAARSHQTPDPIKS